MSPFPNNLSLQIQSGAEVNARGPGGWTALHYAARYGHTDAICRQEPPPPPLAPHTSSIGNHQSTSRLPQTPNHKPQTTNHNPQPHDHKPQTTNHKPQTTIHKAQPTTYYHHPSSFNPASQIPNPKTPNPNPPLCAALSVMLQTCRAWGSSRRQNTRAVYTSSSCRNARSHQGSHEVFLLPPLHLCAPTIMPPSVSFDGALPCFRFLSWPMLAGTSGPRHPNCLISARPLTFSLKITLNDALPKPSTRTKTSLLSRLDACWVMPKSQT